MLALLFFAKPTAHTNPQRIDTLLGNEREGLRLNFGLAMQMHRRSYNSAFGRPAAGGAGVGGGSGGGGGQGVHSRGVAATSAGQQSLSPR